MQVPVRLTVLLRPTIAPGVLLAVAFSTLVLSATPFLLDLVVDEYSIGLTVASLIGVAQLGGFMLASWGAGRFLRPRRRVFVAAMVLAVVANGLSVLLPPYAILVLLRFASGLALGAISWFAWVQVFGDKRGMADVAVMGPLAGVLSAPVIGACVAQGGAPAVFALLAVVATVPLLLNRGTGATDTVAPSGPRSRPVPAAAIMLGALALFGLGGSSVFQYSVVVGTGEVGLTTGTMATLFSVNALVAIPAAKWPWSRGLPGPWMGVTALCALILMTADVPALFGGALIVWGFAFWMAIPGVFTALAERSANPADRAGDAQTVMAAGRIVGPFMGGAVIDGFGPTWLGIIGGGLMLIAGVAVFAVRTTVAPTADPDEARLDA
ncbi:MAG: MFS transporter [Actinomycetota bacterium]